MVIGIGEYKGLGKNFKSIALISDFSLLDADYIFWNFEDTLYDIEMHRSHVKGNLPVLADSIFEKIKNSFESRKEEIAEFLYLGKKLIIELSSKTNVKFITSNGITTFDLLDLMPIDNFSLKKSIGTSIEPSNNSMAKILVENIGKNFQYKSVIKSEINPLMYIKDTKHIISNFFKIDKGLILFVPNFIENSKTETERISFYQNLIAFSDSLIEQKQEELLKPKWVDSIILPAETDQINNLNILIGKKEKIQKEIVKQSILIQDINEKKVLVYGTGIHLELAVEKIFAGIGFEIEEKSNGRDDLIIKHEDFISVVEIKGVGKSAAEKHAAQLEKWVSSYYENHEVNPKGILLVNTFKDKPIDQRTEDDFPSQMLDYSSQRNHCLMTTLQLLSIYYDIVDEKLKIDELIRTIKSTSGIFNYKNRLFK